MSFNARRLSNSERLRSSSLDGVFHPADDVSSKKKSELCQNIGSALYRAFSSRAASSLGGFMVSFMALALKTGHLVPHMGAIIGLSLLATALVAQVITSTYKAHADAVANKLSSEDCTKAWKQALAMATLCALAGGVVAFVLGGGIDLIPTHGAATAAHGIASFGDHLSHHSGDLIAGGSAIAALSAGIQLVPLAKKGHPVIPGTTISLKPVREAEASVAAGQISDDGQMLCIENTADHKRYWYRPQDQGQFLLRVKKTEDDSHPETLSYDENARKWERLCIQDSSMTIYTRTGSGLSSNLPTGVTRVRIDTTDTNRGCLLFYKGMGDDGQRQIELYHGRLLEIIKNPVSDQLFTFTVDGWKEVKIGDTIKQANRTYTLKKGEGWVEMIPPAPSAVPSSISGT